MIMGFVFANYETHEISTLNLKGNKNISRGDFYMLPKGNKRTIFVNQIGYPIEAKKIAVFLKPGSFQIVNVENQQIVYSGEVDPRPIDDPCAGAVVYHGDFSPLKQAGTYVIQQNKETSSPFKIAANPYENVLNGLLKAFYYLRCGMELTEEYAGPWHHGACHTGEAIVYDDPDKRIDCTGGWHDAGDYGRYTVTAAKAVADLLTGFEFFPEAFASMPAIPESDGKTPNILLECRYELEWLLKMQDDETGGVYHKVTTFAFPPLDCMPEDDKADLYISPVSATATASFSAVMALAARIYRAYDEEFASRCLAAAKKAFQWLSAHPEYPGFKNPPDISTGEYGDECDKDERFWASAELYRTTGEEFYHDHLKILAGDPSFSKTGLGWIEMGGFGTIAYLINNERETDEALVTNLQEEWLAEANRIVKNCEEDGFHISLREKDYVWGSNMVLMNNAMVLIVADRICQNEKYITCALEHIHYLLGRNILDVCYITGFGDRPVVNPHHRPSVADEVAAPVPGFVAGGPNKNLNDPYARDILSGKPPAQCFVDHHESYSTNEITIYWNSPAVFVFSYFVAEGS